MTYTADRPQPPESADELRARIPGWGADLDPKDRPSVPKLRFDPGATGAHWDFPERQPEHQPRERSIEHAMLTPVFGTSAPLHGVSGAIRRLAYRRYSEARAAHWLILLGADRVDAVGSHVRSLLTLHPDNPITETGIRAELTGHGLTSRFGRKRVDNAHTWIDPILVAGPWVAAAGGVAAGLAALEKRRRA
ncbi:hypothetical protein [Rhodococcus sp. X156]|uniref:hypothetical protein n=1 Tax=Rhodococcus sp. X156 TaxID=2499145 RepID=UPI000FDCC387|nr:hypothetical protein [Rhodococcus sp. X156]